MYNVVSPFFTPDFFPRRFFLFTFNLQFVPPLFSRQPLDAIITADNAFLTYVDILIKAAAAYRTNRQFRSRF